MSKISIYIISLGLLLPFIGVAQTISIGYDALGRIDTAHYPDGSSIKLSYDNNGNIKTKKTHDPCSSKPRPTVTAIPSILCQGDTAILTTQTGVKYLWSTGDTTQTIKVTLSGKYAVRRLDTFKVFEDTLQCYLVSDSVQIIVKPVPDIDPTTDKVVCNGTVLNAITFNSSHDSTIYQWTGTTNTIGIPVSGTGNIASFIATNNTSNTIIDTIVVTPVRNGCTGKQDTFTITVHPTPTVDSVPSQVVCNGINTTEMLFSGSVNNTTYSWSNNTPAIGLAANGTNIIPPFTASNNGISAITATISVTPSANGCTGTQQSFTIKVNPTPTVNPVIDQSLCNGANTDAIIFTGSVSGTIYSWINTNLSIGLVGGGNGNISSFISVNTTNLPVTAGITVTPTANECIGSSQTCSITVKPTPNVNSVSNQTFCNGTNSSPVIFNGNVPGTIFNWTNNNTSIGLSATGNGNIPSFSTTNASSFAQVATITTTPSANGCTGASAAFTITVNPTPSVIVPSDRVACNGTVIPEITVQGSNVNGTVYNWVNTMPSIGLVVVGTGNIPAFTALNAGTSPVTGTVTITPVANSCPGISRSFTIAVNPTPTVDSISSQILCNGFPTQFIPFNGSVPGSIYHWTNNISSIGLGLNGSGSIPAFSTTNLTNTPLVATIVVTPAANNCIGTSRSFSITVNPTPSVSMPANQSLCSGTMTTAINYGIPAVSGTVYHWTNNLPSIGLASSGIGNIASFQAFNFGIAPTIATINVTPLANNCYGISRNFTITVNPIPIVDSIPSQTLCHGENTVNIPFNGNVNIANVAYNWINTAPSIGLGANGTGMIPIFTVIDTLFVPVIATITVTPVAYACTGFSKNFTITANPIPSVNPLSNQVLCNGDSTTTILFTGPVLGSKYTWTNTDSTIGLPLQDSGNILSFKSVNNSFASDTATITVIPSANGCTGSPEHFTITVNPTPTLDSINDQFICNGDSSKIVTIKGKVLGTAYSWINNNSAIGLPSTGLNDIIPFKTINSADTPVSATIMITPAAHGCLGQSGSFTITVNPTPTVDAVTNQVLCNGGATLDIIFKGTVSQTAFNWTSTDSTIGLPLQDTGNIYSFTALNTGDSPVTATFKVKPIANNCSGYDRYFTITVNPTPHIAPITNQEICNGVFTKPVIFKSGVTGTNFSWSNSETSIGLAGLGQGNIDSFIAKNIGDSPLDAVITAMSEANGCMGTSEKFTFTVNPTLQPAIVINSTLGNIICAGLQDTFNAEINNGGSSPTYEWRVNGKKQGPDDKQYILSALTDKDVITCELTSNAKCLTIPKIVSQEIKMTIKPNLVPGVTITANPGTNVAPWTSILFTANPIYEGAEPSYKWMKNGVPISGATDKTYAGKIGIELAANDLICVMIKSSEQCLKVDSVSNCASPIAVNPSMDKVGKFDQITLHPNPNTGEFTIQGNIYTDKEVNIKIFDGNGKMIYVDKASPKNNFLIKKIKLDELANAKYILHLEQDKESKGLEFVFER